MMAAAILIFDKCLYFQGRLRQTTARRFSSYMLSRALATTTAFSYKRPLSVAWAKSMLCFAYIIFLYFLWPPYAPALVNGGSRNFYTWWTLSVNRQVTTCIFSWSSLNYRVGKKVTKFGIFSAANCLLSHPNAAEYCNSEKKLVKHRWLLYMCATFGELWSTNPWDPRVIKFLKTNDMGE